MRLLVQHGADPKIPTTGGTTALMSGTAGAMMPGNSGMAAAVDGIAITEDVQYGWQGRQYCFYDDGWHGAGWYRCGSRLRVGFGCGGPVGSRPLGEQRRRLYWCPGCQDRK